MRKDIRKLTLAELEEYFQSIGEPLFRARQLHEWVWKKKAKSFADMSNLSKDLRAQLDTEYAFYPAKIEQFQKSKDGTIKNAIVLHDKALVESVLIPTTTRTTACVSSQVGCSLDCTFCATAQLKRMRNLSAAEIYDQVALIDQQSRTYYDRPLSNIVFMGMGEPLLNFNEVVTAIRKITTAQGLNMAPRRITLSTSGIPKMIEKLADENLRIKLALSLHSAIESKRNELMPFSVNFPLSDIQASLRYWYRQTQSIVTFEYLVWNDINDRSEDIDALVRFCKSVPSKVNLIEYNDVEHSPYQGAEERVIQHYIKELEKNNIIVKVRKSRGDDIDAACGQLANKL